MKINLVDEVKEQEDGSYLIPFWNGDGYLKFDYCDETGFISASQPKGPNLYDQFIDTEYCLKYFDDNNIDEERSKHLSYDFPFNVHIYELEKDGLKYLIACRGELKCFEEVKDCVAFPSNPFNVALFFIEMCLPFLR